MRKQIHVIATEDHTVYNHDLTEIRSAVSEGETFVAELYEPTEEYFAKDSEGREFRVVEVDVRGNEVWDEGYAEVGV